MRLLRLHNAVLLFLFLIVFQVHAGESASHTVTVRKLPMNQILSTKTNVDFQNIPVVKSSNQNMICHINRKITLKDIQSDTEINYTQIKNTSFKAIETSGLSESSPQQKKVITVTDL